MRIVNTFPIEMKVDDFGIRMFIVATKTDISVRKSHRGEYSFFAVKHRKAKGMEQRYTAVRYNRDEVEWSCQRT